MSTIKDLRAELRAVEKQLQETFAEIGDVQNRIAQDGDERGGRANKVGELNRRVEKLEAEKFELEDTLEEFDEREQRMRQAAGNPRGHEAGTPPATNGQRRDTSPAGQARDGGLRTIERYVDSGEMSSRAADTMERLVRHPRDPQALSARYLEAVGDPAYFRAFGKALADPTHGHLRFTPEEVAAWQKTVAVEAERGLITGTGSQGGFALPIQIDPSILLTSSGALNPIRQLARVITIATTEWRGVSSAGVTASYDAEASEVSDDTPVLAQPVILAETGRAFVPFSIEAGQDWSGLEQELLRLIADGRDVLDAVQFYSGTGTDSPAGVRTGLAVGQRVQTDVAATLDIDDVYDIKGQLPARFIAGATFAAHPTKLDTIYRYTPSGSTTEPQAMPTRDGALIGKPVAEWTSVPTALTTGTTQLLYGDFRAAYTIVDRLGMTAELVPHLFGAGRRPTGERGLFAYWRTGAKVVVPEALRYLETL